MMRRLLILGALAVTITAGCSDGGEQSAPSTTSEATAATPEPTTTEATTSATDSSSDDAEPSTNAAPDTTSTSTTTTTTVAPEPQPDESFDIDREFSPDSEAEALGPIGTTETTIPTDEGEFSVGGGEVPELGEDFPLPDGFEMQLTTEIEGEIGFSGRVSGELGDLVEFFDDVLPAVGYEITEREEVPGVFTVLAVDGPLTGDVVIAQEPGVDGGWTIAVGLAESG